MRKLALLLILSSVLLVQGCGFKLRGQVDLPPALQSVYVDGPDPVLVDDLKRSLDFSGAQIVSSPEVASAAVLLDSRYERVVRTLDARGVATGYVLRYDARFRVVDASGEQLQQSQVITLRRNFDFSADELLQKEGEEEFLKSDMRSQIVQRVLRQLSSM
jgi:LPS-assembly lipoprotein